MLHNIISSGDSLLLMDAQGRLGHWILKRQGGEVCGPVAMDQKGIAVLGHVVEGNLCRFFSFNVLGHINAGCRVNKS
jgi:hypothetical protein